MQPSIPLVLMSTNGDSWVTSWMTSWMTDSVPTGMTYQWEYSMTQYSWTNTKMWVDTHHKSLDQTTQTFLTALSGMHLLHHMNILHHAKPHVSSHTKVGMMGWACVTWVDRLTSRSMILTLRKVLTKRHCILKVRLRLWTRDEGTKSQLDRLQIHKTDAVIA